MSYSQPLCKLPQPTISSVKKRKRDDEGNQVQGESDSRHFSVKPDSSKPFAKTRTFVPVCLLGRAQLPLAYLDTSAGSRSRLFASDIRTLEALHQVGEHDRVLVAEEKEGGRMFAVERVKSRIYALCGLEEWVGKGAVEKLAVASVEKEEVLPKRRAVETVEGAPWWKRAAVGPLPETAHQSSGPAPKPKLMLWQNESDPSRMTIAAGASVGDERNPSRHDIPAETTHETPSEPLSATDMLEELSKQYLDALYLSRTSLAYFAKGPLSRARAAFTGPADSETHTSVLTTFLRETILVSSVMDKKYRDNIATVVKELPLQVEGEQMKPVKAKRKRKWKAKRDKQGFFSNEQEFLATWWREGDVNVRSVSPETADTALKRRLPALRTRETYLQIIVILETLAVEASSKNDAGRTSKAPPAAPDSQNAETQDAGESQPVKKSKARKELDLSTQLGTLLDHLTIWSSLSLDSPARTLAQEPTSDLRNFCTEVVIPFYMPRIPKDAASVNKKLGGPSPPSPAKRTSSTTTGSRTSRPGEPATRQPPERRPRKPLSRAPTETNNSQTPKAPPGLHRSATEPQLVVKREPSDFSSVAAIPQGPAAAPRKRPDYLKNFREVDLDAKHAAAEAKLKKKAEQESQIREAVKLARKPDRGAANAEVARRADELHARARAKPGRATARPHLLHAPATATATTSGAGEWQVHVAATPRRPRTSAPFGHPPGPSAPPSSSFVPASSVRPRAPPLVHHAESTPEIPQTASYTRAHTRQPGLGVQETPSRPHTTAAAEASHVAFADAEGLCESPSARRSSRAAVAATPVKGASLNFNFNSDFNAGAEAGAGALRAVLATPAKGQHEVLATPVKGGGLFADTNKVADRYESREEEAEAEGNKGEERSIYAQLGWEDEEYEPLA